MVVDEEVQASVKAYDGSDFIITRRRWRHAIERHPGMEKLLDAVLLVGKSPDEAYVDSRGTIHLLKALKDVPSDFLGSNRPQTTTRNVFSRSHPCGQQAKEKGVSSIQKATTLVDIDLKDVLERVKRRYHLRIPPRVIMADYDEKEGDLYIRFSEVEQTEGEPSKDGVVIFHRDRKNAIAAMEILSLAEL